MLAYPVLSLRSVGPCRLLVSRLLVGILKLECCPSTAGGYQTVLPLPCCCLLFGSRDRHDAPGALRGSFFHSEHVARWWCIQRSPPLCCRLLLVAAIVLISCCDSPITVGLVGTILALLAFGDGPLTGISLLFQSKNPLLWY
jgi:hypothetical protein